MWRFQTPTPLIKQEPYLTSTVSNKHEVLHFISAAPKVSTQPGVPLAAIYDRPQDLRQGRYKGGPLQSISIWLAWQVATLTINAWIFPFHPFLLDFP
jgi:hypothetical protein